MKRYASTGSWREEWWCRDVWSIKWNKKCWWEAFMIVRHDMAQLLKYIKVDDGGDVQHDVDSWGKVKWHNWWLEVKWHIVIEEDQSIHLVVRKHFNVKCDHFIILYSWKTHVISFATIMSAECHVCHRDSNSLQTACHFCQRASNSLLKRYRVRSFLKQFFGEPSGAWVALPGLLKSVVVFVEGGRAV